MKLLNGNSLRSPYHPHSRIGVDHQVSLPLDVRPGRDEEPQPTSLLLLVSTVRVTTEGTVVGLPVMRVLGDMVGEPSGSRTRILITFTPIFLKVDVSTGVNIVDLGLRLVLRVPLEGREGYLYFCLPVMFVYE